MNTSIISVENLGKKYCINHRSERERNDSLRDVIAEGAKRLFRTASWRRSAHGVVTSPRTEEFWSLKDVSFEVKEGEVIGVIGRNGAGKSTLLKILSLITEPTTGCVRIRGRIASLLEVGTGFHPELTGRENIYLNGIILGMNRIEIRRKFDEIVAFAGVERFLDTPVKRYSSGMQVRLAFAVAAHLEPEILIVDEVLAVGDAEFQRKCLGRMQEVSKGGRTVLFVSHNIAVINALCPKVLLLEAGMLKFIGDADEASAIYLGANTQARCLERQASLDGRPTITRIDLTKVECQRNTVLEFSLQISGKTNKRHSLEVKLFDAIGGPVGLASVGLLSSDDAIDLREGMEYLRCRIVLPRMARGTYRLSVQLAIPMVEVSDSIGDGLMFELHPAPLAGYERVMESSWGYGAFEVPLEVERIRSSRPVEIQAELKAGAYAID